MLTRFTDYRTLLTLLPESSTQRSEINRALRNLEPRIENRRKEETGEMMGKLKELGNTFLGSPRNESFRTRCDESPQATSDSRQTISNLNRTAKGGIPSTSPGDCCSSVSRRFRVGTLRRDTSPTRERDRPVQGSACRIDPFLQISIIRWSPDAAGASGKLHYKSAVITGFRKCTWMGFGTPQRFARARSGLSSS